jgi:hypothetical protein
MIPLIIYWFVTTTFGIAIDLSLSKVNSKPIVWKDIIVDILFAWLIVPFYLGVVFVQWEEKFDSKH